MAFTPHHNITGSTGVNVELLAPGDGASNIKSILIANVHDDTDATVSLFIQNDPEGRAASTYYLIKQIAIPSSTSLLLDNSNMLSFNNGPNGYGLYITVGGSDTVDVSITR